MLYKYKFRWRASSRTWELRYTAIDRNPAKTSMFVRMYTVSAARVELFSQRALLRTVKGPKCFSDLKKIPAEITKDGILQELPIDHADYSIAVSRLETVIFKYVFLIFNPL